MDTQLSTKTKRLLKNGIYHKQQGWFFPTSEGIDMGPFPDQISAELEYVRYTQYLQVSEKRKLKTSFKIAS